MWMSPRECKESLLEMGAVVIMPTYNNAGTVGAVLADLVKYSEDILVVDDGCTDLTMDILRTFGFSELSGTQKHFRGKKVLRHETNKGKGAALKNAFAAASGAGFKYALTIDADGQHYPGDLPLFVQAHREHPESLLVGSRNLESENMPQRNTFANRFSNFWYRLETGIRLEDTQCGYRLYPLRDCSWSKWYYTALYEFELVVIVFAAWSGRDVRNVPVRVYYPPQDKRVSHFKPLRDFTRISILNTLLVLVSLLYIKPRNFLRLCTWKNICAFFDRNLIHVQDSNRKIVFSVWTGTFCAFLPFYGYQLILAVFLAHLLKLNKLVAGAFSAVSLPPLIPFIVFGSYWLGCAILGRECLVSLNEMTFEIAGRVLQEYILGGLVFAAVASSLFAAFSALILKLFRRG